MSYPPPPGLNGPQTPSSRTPSSSTPQQHSSLPPRPPPAAGPPPSFKAATTSIPGFSGGAPGTRGYNGANNNGVSQPSSSYTGFTGFQPRSVAAANAVAFQTHSPVVSAPPAPPTGFTGPYTGFSSANAAYQPPQQQYHQQSSQPVPYFQPVTEDTYSQATPPQIRNPFPLPGQESSAAAFGRGRGASARTGFQDDGLDPEMEAQIAQWQSAYASKDSDNTNPRSGSRMMTSSRHSAGEGALSASGANAGPLGGSNRSSDITGSASSHNDVTPAAPSNGATSTTSAPDGRQKTVLRSGGGQTWQDPTLLEWDPAHFRLFVGNLAGEVTDESLLKAFSKYSSVQKARVVRDKRTTKSKGFGFVSFSDGEEYFQAAREMQGKYIGSHPVLLRKSTTEIRPVVSGDANRKGGKNGKGGKGAGGGQSGGSGGVKTGAGVQKKQAKTKGGLKILG